MALHTITPDLSDPWRLRTRGLIETLQLMSSAGGERNRFGGYRINLGNWKVEAWLLENTWARQAGICDVETLEDVFDTTFFDWDAIAYDVTRRRVVCDVDYFERIASRILEIRLHHHKSRVIPGPLSFCASLPSFRRRYIALGAPRVELF